MKRSRTLLPSAACAPLAALLALSAMSLPAVAGEPPANVVASADRRPSAARSADAGTSARLDAFLEHPLVIARIHATGMQMSEVRRDLDHLSPAERSTLADLLEKRWPGDGTSRQVELAADYLMLVALMRESRLFASVVTRTVSPRSVPGASPP